MDVTRLLDRGLQGRLATGVDRVMLEYVRHYQDRAQALVRFAGRWLVLGRAQSRCMFSVLLEQDVRAMAGRLRGLVAMAYVLRWGRPGPGAVLMNMGHSGLQDADYARRMQAYGWRGVYFLHDLIPLTHPEYCRAGEALLHQRRVQTMLGTGCAVVLNSEDTLRQLQACAQARGWQLPPCLVAPLAPGRLPQPAAQRPLAQPYFVMLGTIEPRKNHLLLLQLWRQWVQEAGAAAVPRLVLIGQRGWECEQVLDMLERCPALQGVVLELGRCTDEELAGWLAHAQALLFPSFAEGYGIPLAEALALGVPVLASDLPVFHEIAGDIPEYLDPLDGVAWRLALQDYARTGHGRRQAQLQRLQGWQGPAWPAHLSRVDGWLHSRHILAPFASGQST